MSFKVAEVKLFFRYGKNEKAIYPFMEYVRVYPDEEISEVITALKERLYYNWDDAPLIEKVNYRYLENPAI